MAGESVSRPSASYTADIQNLLNAVDLECSRQAQSPADEPSGDHTKSKYTIEQMLFIWYNRVDQNRSWEDVKERYNQLFESRSVSGLECKFYRILGEEFDVPKTRKQRKWAERKGEKYEEKAFGMIQWLEKPDNTTWAMAQKLKRERAYEWVKGEDHHRWCGILDRMANIDNSI